MFISDFRQPNKQIKCTTCPLPHTKDILNKLSNFTYAMELYLIMGYYNTLLTDAAKKVYMITTPFGKYGYNRLPMGVCIVPYISGANERSNGQLRVYHSLSGRFSCHYIGLI